MSTRVDPLRNTLDHLALDPKASQDRRYLVSMLRRLGYSDAEIEAHVGPLGGAEGRVIEVEYEGPVDRDPQAAHETTFRVAQPGDDGLTFRLSGDEAPAGAGVEEVEATDLGGVESDLGDWGDFEPVDASEPEAPGVAPDDFAATDEFSFHGDEQEFVEFREAERPDPALAAGWKATDPAVEAGWHDENTWSDAAPEEAWAEQPEQAEWAEAEEPAWEQGGAAEPWPEGTAEPEPWPEAPPEPEPWPEAEPEEPDSMPEEPAEQAWEQPPAEPVELAPWPEPEVPAPEAEPEPELEPEPVEGYTHGDYRLYTREVQLSTGREQRIYFFAKREPASGEPCPLPEGYEVIENEKTGLPFLRRER